MESALFTIDDIITVNGIHDPQVRWNGWACPFFPLESVQTISDYFGSLNEYEYEDCLQGGIVRVVDGVPHWVHMEDTETMFPISPVSIDGTDYYDIGSNGWCWAVVGAGF